jgi:hypothetical protein
MVKENRKKRKKSKIKNGEEITIVKVVDKRLREPFSI